ncbi:MAG TPA: class I SAM-dependent methyltransferase [Patescibacteria group bacterium]|nr:class I SAM-dependent methyltransferase [Patescibacteria group bacterium]
MAQAKSQEALDNAERYDAGDYNYQDYWKGREYEDAAERMAFRRLLKGRHFRHAVDVGGGYGRLCIFLEKYADKVTLAEPSQKQLDIASDFLKDHPRIEKKKATAANLGFADGSVDLITIVRILHHIPQPAPEFHEIARVLADDGIFIMEFANYTHFLNRLKQVAKLKRFPAEPVDIRRPENRNDNEPPFVNHNPKTVSRQLAHAGLKVEKVLSVSNLRSPGLKKILPKPVLLSLEKLMQPTLAKTYFGPSTFFLIKKAK